MNKVDILAIAFGGGHLEQLLEITPPVVYSRSIALCTTAELTESPKGYNWMAKFVDCNKNELVNVVWCGFQVTHLLLLARPKFIISTGAAPGLLLIIVGRALGCKCIWVDSVANADRLSLSGKIAKRIVTLTFSQWRHVDKKEAVHYKGSIL